LLGAEDGRVAVVVEGDEEDIGNQRRRRRTTCEEEGWRKELVLEDGRGVEKLAVHTEQYDGDSYQDHEHVVVAHHREESSPSRDKPDFCHCWCRLSGSGPAALRLCCRYRPQGRG